MEHFGRVRDHRPSSIPMQKIVAFAIFSTRRQEEITLLRWDDLDGDRILVRDMKHPGDKKGNNVYCELPPEGTRDYQFNAARGRRARYFPIRLMQSVPHSPARVKFLGIEDLRFHDLRHEGISRLFEIGKDNSTGRGCFRPSKLDQPEAIYSYSANVATNIPIGNGCPSSLLKKRKKQTKCNSSEDTPRTIHRDRDPRWPAWTRSDIEGFDEPPCPSLVQASTVGA